MLSFFLVLRLALLVTRIESFAQGIRRAKSKRASEGRRKRSTVNLFQYSDRRACFTNSIHSVETI